MPAGPKGQVRTACAFAHHAVAVVDHLLIFVLFAVGDFVGQWVAVLVPAVGLPMQGLGEEIRGSGGDAWCGEEGVRGGDGVGFAGRGGHGDGHGGFDFAHHAVDGSVESQGFLDDLGVEREVLEIVVGQGWEVLAQHPFLLCEKFFLDVGPGGETERNPCGRG